MKYPIFSIVFVLLVSGCMCLECETLSPEELEMFSTGMAIQNPATIAADDKPTLICYGDLEADEWSAIQVFMADVQAEFGAAVTITEASSERLAGYPPYEDLQLESIPACLIFTSEPAEVFRTYDDFTLETFAAQLRGLLGE